jgi:hypothetical protein
MRMTSFLPTSRGEEGADGVKKTGCEGALFFLLPIDDLVQVCICARSQYFSSGRELQAGQ